VFVIPPPASDVCTLIEEYLRTVIVYPYLL